jgi:hypothetical protein
MDQVRISPLVLGCPERRDRHHQWMRKPLRCHLITVAGLRPHSVEILCRRDGRRRFTIPDFATSVA